MDGNELVQQYIKQIKEEGYVSKSGLSLETFHGWKHIKEILLNDRELTQEIVQKWIDN